MLQSVDHPGRNKQKETKVDDSLSTKLAWTPKISYWGEDIGDLNRSYFGRRPQNKSNVSAVGGPAHSYSYGILLSGFYCRRWRGSLPLFGLFNEQYLPLTHFKAPLPPGL